ncbi:MAG TPA: type II toxin-antitoxin system Phd/YefM family antitoxin [Patescibacteria group bacterium]|nr:type II toxin-antitoxin system Phd/YefM family antitoxin [Patescibacteria group bacterium]
MTTYTFSEARQKFAAVLEKAKSDGRVLIKRKDGSTFMIAPVLKPESPLDVEGVDLDITTDDIVRIVREIRRR